MTINRQEAGLAAIFIGFGLLFGLTAWFDLPMGRAARIGPGYFPFALSCALVILGLIIALRGVRLPEVSGKPIPWRGVILVLASPVFFGFALEGLGVIPTVAIGAFFTFFASRRATVPTALALAALLAIFCWLVFVVGLGVPVRPVGPWLGFLPGV